MEVRVLFGAPRESPARRGFSRSGHARAGWGPNFSGNALWQLGSTKGPQWTPPIWRSHGRAVRPATRQVPDELLSDPGLLAPIGARWERLLAETGAVSGRGRPTIAMATYVRLMIIKHRSGWGYETLMREVSDSIHLRRFCRIGMTERVPDESTVRKLTRRLGAEVVHEITRELIQKARREKRFRPRAARIDSTVIEADMRWPTDSGLAADGVKALAREGRKLAAKVGRSGPPFAIAPGRWVASSGH